MKALNFKSVLFLFTILSNISSIYSQTTDVAKILDLYSKEIDVEEKINLLHKVCEIYVEKDIDSSLFYINKAIVHANEIEADISLAKSYKLLSKIYKQKLLFNKAIKTTLNAIPILEENNLLMDLAYSFNHIGENYMALGNEERALEYYFLAESTYTKTDSITAYRLWNLTNLAEIYISASIYSKALESLRKAQKMAESEVFYRQLGEIYLMMASIYENQDDFENAVKHFEAALEVFENNKDEDNILITKLNMAGTYVVWGKFDIATSIFNDLPDSTGNPDYSFFMHLGRAEVDLNRKKYLKALSNNSIALEISVSLKNESLKLLVDFQKAKILRSIGDVDKSINLLEKSLQQTVLDSDISTKLDMFQLLSEMYIQKGNYKTANENMSKYLVLKESVSKNQRIKETEFLKLLFDEEKAQVIIKKKEENLINLKEKERITRKYNILLKTGFGLLLILAIIIFYNQRKLLISRKKTEILEKEKLEQTIDYSSQQIMDLSIHVQEKNNLLNKIKSSISEISLHNEQGKKKLSEVTSSINEDIRLNKQRIELYSIITEKNINFFQNLNQKFPELTTKEQKIVQMLRLELSSKQIAEQLSLSVFSIDTYRSKIRKKLNIPKNTKLSDFIKNLGSRTSKG